MPSTHSNLYVHVVFSTKRRQPFLRAEIRNEVHAYLGGILKSLDVIPLTIGGVADHVHLLTRVRPAHQVSEVVRQLKRGSSAWIHNHLRRREFEWQEGYGAFSVSHAHVVDVRRYIETQAEHHRKTSFKEEYVALLETAGIEFDDRYLW